MIIVDPNMDLEHSYIIENTAKICNTLFKIEHQEILITFNGEACEGYEAVTIPSKGKFLIALNPDMNWETDELVKTIGHELTHVKQFTYDGLEFDHDDVVVFRNSEYRFENDMEYWLSPWEIEARGYEAGIWMLYYGEHEK